MIADQTLLHEVGQRGIIVPRGKSYHYDIVVELVQHAELPKFAGCSVVVGPQFDPMERILSH